jgi:hypothetical protein
MPFVRAQQQLISTLTCHLFKDVWPAAKPAIFSPVPIIRLTSVAVQRMGGLRRGHVFAPTVSVVSNTRYFFDERTVFGDSSGLLQRHGTRSSPVA